MRRWIFLSLFLQMACAPASERGFRSEAKKIVREMSAELAPIETHEELQAAIPVLRKKLNELGDLLLSLREYRQKHPEKIFSKEPLEGSEALFAELARLYEIPGCREIIEQAQTEAIHKLL